MARTPRQRKLGDSDVIITETATDAFVDTITEHETAEISAGTQVMVAPETAPLAIVDDNTAANAVDFFDDLEQISEGRGVSRAAEDIIIPSLYVLQGLSPQVDPQNPAYIEGARPGDIWLKNFRTPVVRGNVGFLFQLCGFYTDWFEWIPRTRGGGFVAVHPSVVPVRNNQGRVVALRTPDGTMAKEMPDPRDPTGKKKFWQTPGDNELSEMRHHIGFIMDKNGTFFPYAMNLTSTGHTASKQLMATLGVQFLPNGRPLDSYAKLYKFTTFQRERNGKKWYSFQHADATLADIVPGTYYIDDTGRVIETRNGELVKIAADKSWVQRDSTVPEYHTRLRTGLYVDAVGITRGKMLFDAINGGRRVEVDAEGVSGANEEQLAENVRQSNNNAPGYEDGDPGYDMDVPF